MRLSENVYRGRDGSRLALSFSRVLSAVYGEMRMWRDIRPNRSGAFVFSHSARLQRAACGPVPAEARFEYLAPWRRSRRHSDGFGCQQPGRGEGRGFPGPPSQSPSNPSRETMAGLSAGISSLENRRRTKTGNILANAHGSWHEENSGSFMSAAGRRNRK
jgi:hypothetical protein